MYNGTDEAVDYQQHASTEPGGVMCPPQKKFNTCNQIQGTMKAINILSSEKVPWLQHKAHSNGQSDTLLVQYCWLDSQSKFVKNQHLKKCCSFFPFS